MSDKEKKETKLAVVGGTAIEKTDGKSEGKHEDIRQKVLDLRDKVEESYWDLSQVLYEVYGKSYYLEWGFGSWQQYVEQELDYKLRKAQYLISIQDWFSKMNESVQDWVKKLGWTRAKELVGIVTNENLEEWRAKVEGKTVKEIIDLIQNRPQGSDDNVELKDGPSGGDDKDIPIRVSFKLFREQKANVDRALDLAMRMAESSKPGHAIDLICTDFLSTNAGIDDVAGLLKKIEHQTGVKLIGIDEKTDSVVFGGDTLDRVTTGDMAEAPKAE